MSLVQANRIGVVGAVIVGAAGWSFADRPSRPAADRPVTGAVARPQSSPPAKSAPVIPMPSAAARQVEGSIILVQTQGVMLNVGSDQLWVSVSPMTKIDKDFRPASIHHLAAGDYVIAEAVGHSDHVAALEINAFTRY